MLYNSPRNDQPSAKTSQTSLTDLSLAIGTAYESIHTFVFSHEKSLIRDFRIFVIIFFFFFSKRPSASRLAGKCCSVFQHRPKIIMADSEHMVTTTNTHAQYIYVIIRSQHHTPPCLIHISRSGGLRFRGG